MPIPTAAALFQNVTNITSSFASNFSNITSNVASSAAPAARNFFNQIYSYAQEKIQEYGPFGVAAGVLASFAIPLGIWKGAPYVKRGAKSATDTAGTVFHAGTGAIKNAALNGGAKLSYAKSLLFSRFSRKKDDSGKIIVQTSASNPLPTGSNLPPSTGSNSLKLKG